jgi:hypothetical protein
MKFTVTTKYPSAEWVAVKFPSNLVPSVLCYKDPDSTLTINSVKVTVGTRLVMLGVTGNVNSVALKFICDMMTTGGTAEAVGDVEVQIREKEPLDWSTDDYLINKKSDINPGLTIADPAITNYFEFFEFVW